MTFKRFIAILVIGITLSVGFVFFLKLRSRVVTDDLSTPSVTLPQTTPRSIEIPDEIRQKFAEIPKKPNLITVIEHGSPIDSVYFSPIDPSLIVSRGRDKSIKLWDTNYPSEPVAILTGDSLSISPDGKLLAICSLRNGTSLWSVEKKQYIVSDGISSREAIFSPNGKRLAIGTIGGVQLWNIDTPSRPIKGLKLHTKGIVENMGFSADGKYLSAANRVSGDVDIWELNGNEANKITNFNVSDEKPKWVEALEFVPDATNPVLAIAKNDKNIQLHSPPDWKVTTEIITGHVNDLVFSSDANLLVAAGYNEITIWAADGARILSIETNSRWVNCVDISSDSAYVAGAGNDGIIRIWNVSQNNLTEHISSSDVVKLIYFLPSDRAPRPDIPEKLNLMIQDVRKYFADEMERHGFGRRTFSFEKNSDGTAKVYLFEGRTTDDYYFIKTTKKVTKEVDQFFDSSKNIHLIIADISKTLNKKSSGIVSASPNPYTIDYTQDLMGLRGGEVIMTVSRNGYSTELVARELGHTLGLDNDFRDASYLMSYGRSQKRLSKSSAEWLDKSRYFNPNQTSYNSHSSIVKQAPLPNVVRLHVKDADGIHQVRLFVKPTNEFPPPGYELNINPDINKIDWERKQKGKDYVLHDYVKINLKPNATVEFKLPDYSENQLRVQVIDIYGNMVYRELNLTDENESSITKLVRSVTGG
ncbi:MAG: hypothetical protein OXD54_15660 [Candidatus Poribacteria bacterium]|nr:hypothetical protein [Candidatus Poribacteria bacterium]